MSLIAILVLPLAAMVLCLVPLEKISSTLAGWIAPVATLLAAAAVLALAIGDSLHVAAGNSIIAIANWIQLDGLSALILLLVGLVGTTAALFSWGYMARRAHGEKRRRLYYVHFNLFFFALLAVPLAVEPNLVWVAIEFTALFSVLLVAYENTHEALEAAWKYIAMMFMGAAIALFGFLILFWAFKLGGGVTYTWAGLRAAAPHMPPVLTKTAFLMILVGFGMKVGFVPMHTWLPDAHSQAPAPVSALMSGVLLTVAFYALLRFKVIADGALGPDYVRTLLVIVGLASLLVAASLLLTQRDYKRMLAYHSIEHMGLIALGAAAGTTLAIAAVLLHILGHGLAKAVLFLASGEILLVEGTSEIEKVPALLSRRPVLGGIFGFGLVALLGLPPFSLFVSELNMIRAELDVGLGWAAGISLALMAVIFAAVMGHGRHLLLGGAGASGKPAATPGIVAIPLVGGLIACAVFGLSAWPLQSLLYAAAHVVVK